MPLSVFGLVEETYHCSIELPRIAARLWLCVGCGDDGVVGGGGSAYSAHR